MNSPPLCKPFFPSHHRPAGLQIPPLADPLSSSWTLEVVFSESSSPDRTSDTVSCRPAVVELDLGSRFFRVIIARPDFGYRLLPTRCRRVGPWKSFFPSHHRPAGLQIPPLADPLWSSWTFEVVFFESSSPGRTSDTVSCRPAVVELDLGSRFFRVIIVKPDFRYRLLPTPLWSSWTFEVVFSSHHRQIGLQMPSS